MTLVIQKAVKHQAKLKMCIAGPPGAGKTFTSLTFARELANGGKVLVLDSEKGSASLYSDEFEFDTIQLWSRDKNRQPIKDPFHPRKYMEAVHIAEEGGYAVLVIDSLSHCWNDEGGFLSLNRRIAAQKYHNNTAAAWLDTDPLYREFVNTLTDARLHIIATVRSKSEIDISKNDKGETKVSKLGTKVVQRDELEFEFTIYCRMETSNTLIVEKTRCRAVNGAVVDAPTAQFIKPVIEWLGNGVPEERPLPVAQDVPQPVPLEPTPQDIEMHKYLAEFQDLYPSYCSKMADWHVELLRNALGLAEHEPVSTTFTDDDVARVGLYIAAKKAEKVSQDGTPITEQQIASIRKLMEHLSRSEPENLEKMTYAAAKQMIADLSQEYRQSRAKVGSNAGGGR
jgi:DNA polymerase III delta prime subunit